jgi:hypothetical protein
VRRLISITVVAVVSFLVSGAPVFAQSQSSPEAACDVPGSLCEMLSLVPDILIDRPDLSSVFSYANAAAQRDALGVSRPVDPEDPEFTRWSLAMRDVPIGGVFFPYLHFWPEEMGFSVFDLDQSLEAGDPPDRIILLRGRFDEGRIVETWTRMGYQEISADGATVWKLRDDYEMDLVEGGRTTQLNHRNYAAFVRSDIVVFASNLADMTSVVGTSGKLLRPLSERPEVAELVEAVGPDVAAAWSLSGASIGSTGNLVLLSLTPGGPMPEESLRGTPLAWTPADDMRCLLAIKYPEGTDVEAVATQIAGNLETLPSNYYQVPYQEIFAERSVVADTDRSIVLIELTSSEEFRPGIAAEMLFRLDLGFLV